ncbi:hypothetical protein AAG570_008585 [Ranatra chinensis]|uniref:Uncharacterized protein n=1 Tax=Ranatra chinensis TaxID=642074 RepID=A0ABD0Z223_9HEMI
MKVAVQDIILLARDLTGGGSGRNTIGGQSIQRRSWQEPCSYQMIRSGHYFQQADSGRGRRKKETGTGDIRSAANDPMDPQGCRSGTSGVPRGSPVKDRTKGHTQ